MPRGAAVRIEIESGFAVERRMITREHRLVCDRARCVGCDVCSAICPQAAITRLPGVARDGRLASRPAIDVDPGRCCFCGECVVLCPTRALRLEVDGEARLPILELGAFPRLEQETSVDEQACTPSCGLACQAACPRQAIAVEAERSGDGGLGAILRVSVDRERCTCCSRCAAACPVRAITVRKPWRGRIRLDSGRCPDGCRACADLCPNGALAVRGERVTLDERFCSYCGACARLCPREGALAVLRSGIRHAPVRSGAWHEALEKLVSPVALAMELDAAAQARRQRAVSYLPGAGRG